MKPLTTLKLRSLAVTLLLVGMTLTLTGDLPLLKNRIRHLATEENPPSNPSSHEKTIDERTVDYVNSMGPLEKADNAADLYSEQLSADLIAAVKASKTPEERRDGLFKILIIPAKVEATLRKDGSLDAALTESDHTLITNQLEGAILRALNRSITENADNPSYLIDAKLELTNHELKYIGHEFANLLRKQDRKPIRNAISRAMRLIPSWGTIISQSEAAVIALKSQLEGNYQNTTQQLQKDLLEQETFVSNEILELETTLRQFDDRIKSSETEMENTLEKLSNEERELRQKQRTEWSNVKKEVDAAKNELKGQLERAKGEIKSMMITAEQQRQQTLNLLSRGIKQEQQNARNFVTDLENKRNKTWARIQEKSALLDKRWHQFSQILDDTDPEKINAWLDEKLRSSGKHLEETARNNYIAWRERELNSIRSELQNAKQQVSNTLAAEFEKTKDLLDDEYKKLSKEAIEAIQKRNKFIEEINQETKTRISDLKFRTERAETVVKNWKAHVLQTKDRELTKTADHYKGLFNNYQNETNNLAHELENRKDAFINNAKAKYDTLIKRGNDSIAHYQDVVKSRSETIENQIQSSIRNIKRSENEIEEKYQNTKEHYRSVISRTMDDLDRYNPGRMVKDFVQLKDNTLEHYRGVIRQQTKLIETAYQNITDSIRKGEREVNRVIGQTENAAAFLKDFKFEVDPDGKFGNFKSPADAQRSLRVMGGLLNQLGMKEEGDTLVRVGDGIVRVAKAWTELKNHANELMKNFENLSQLLDGKLSATSLANFGAGLTTGTAFLQIGASLITTGSPMGGPDPQAQMMQMLSEMRVQIDELRKEMNTRFDRVDQSLEDLHTKIDAGFCKMDTRFDEVRQDMEEQKQTLASIQDQLDRLEQQGAQNSLATFFENRSQILGTCFPADFAPGEENDFNEFEGTRNLSGCINEFYKKMLSPLGDALLSKQKPSETVLLDAQAQLLYSSQGAKGFQDAYARFMPYLLNSVNESSNSGVEDMPNPLITKYYTSLLHRVVIENSTQLRDTPTPLSVIINQTRNQLSNLETAWATVGRSPETLRKILKQKYLNYVSSWRVLKIQTEQLLRGSDSMNTLAGLNQIIANPNDLKDNKFIKTSEQLGTDQLIDSLSNLTQIPPCGEESDSRASIPFTAEDLRHYVLPKVRLLGLAASPTQSQVRIRSLCHITKNEDTHEDCTDYLDPDPVSVFVPRFGRSWIVPTIEVRLKFAINERDFNLSFRKIEKYSEDPGFVGCSIETYNKDTRRFEDGYHTGEQNMQQIAVERGRVCRSSARNYEPIYSYKAKVEYCKLGNSWLWGSVGEENYRNNLRATTPHQVAEWISGGTGESAAEKLRNPHFKESLFSGAPSCCQSDDSNCNSLASESERTQQLSSCNSKLIASIKEQRDTIIEDVSDCFSDLLRKGQQSEACNSLNPNTRKKLVTPLHHFLLARFELLGLYAWLLPKELSTHPTLHPVFFGAELLLPGGPDMAQGLATASKALKGGVTTIETFKGLLGLETNSTDEIALEKALESSVSSNDLTAFCGHNPSEGAAEIKSYLEDPERKNHPSGTSRKLLLAGCMLAHFHSDYETKYNNFAKKDPNLGKHPVIEQTFVLLDQIEEMWKNRVDESVLVDAGNLAKVAQYRRNVFDEFKLVAHTKIEEIKKIKAIGR